MEQNQKPELQQSWSKDSERVVSLFKAIHKVYRDYLYKKSRQYGFTGPQIGLIMGLHKNPFSTLNELSECLGLSKSTVSGIVDRLVSQGVVIREIPESNRRIVRLSLSPEWQKNNAIQELMNNYIYDTLKNASAEEMERIILGLEILYSLISKSES
ncbi:MarR family winged helix-turn-helix transcriptional regulator [Desulfosporosinus nitroreducens]|uniref:MarR family transcriptional regulator n=1 Tax=Desulfosporosinus nitroreducens TaxID=2018668 RepID=A0ABT8QQA7_9FIRM|nr:MarR family transcriptional regulator [Desulfosporosinus nitroreducens]MCO1600760.1 MarR family transcriptional regulator [Desulfosporosinus nitroreducens]MDO0822273.1 MarR family transcriptional regulator [Desulfosporosinus nitroreducens]